VSEVIEENLCTYCGICKAVCPVNCIELEPDSLNNRIEVKTKDCIECGKCRNVCPGRENRKDVLDGPDRYIGPFKEGLILDSPAKLKNKYTASGGFVTSFLTFLLEEEYIDGAICVRSFGKDLSDSESVIIRDPKNLVSTSGSLYFRVPLSKALRKIREEQGKYAIIGLPCQIRGLNNLEEHDIFSEKLFIKIGLFCGYMLGHRGRKQILEKYGSEKKTKNENIEKVSYRANIKEKNNVKKDGLLIETKKRNDIFIPKSQYISLNKLFIPKRCLMCSDMTNETSDISCGDSHFLEKGKSLVMTRNKFSNKLVKEAIKKGYLEEYDSVRKEEIINSQKYALGYKKESIKARLHIMRVLNGSIPEIKNLEKLDDPSISQWIGSILLILKSYLTRKKSIRELIRKLPNKSIKISSGLTGKLLRKK